jgi:hypothetical protein
MEASIDILVYAAGGIVTQDYGGLHSRSRLWPRRAATNLTWAVIPLDTLILAHIVRVIFAWRVFTKRPFNN